MKNTKKATVKKEAYKPGSIAPKDLYYSDKHGKLVAMDDVDYKYHDRLELVYKKGDKIEHPMDESLWANINAKKKAGKKSSHGNSKAYKAAKKAGTALKKSKNETKGAPKGHYFTKSGNLVKGTLSKDAKERGARLSDPKDKQRSKVPPVTQYKEQIGGSSRERLTNLARNIGREEFAMNVLEIPDENVLDMLVDELAKLYDQLKKM